MIYIRRNKLRYISYCLKPIDYSEECENGYYYSEECNYEDEYYSNGRCESIEIDSSGTNSECTQIFSYDDDTWESRTISDCSDDKGGYDNTIEITSNYFFGILNDYYYENHYYYVEETRNRSGSCITDTDMDLDDYCIESYQYSIDSPEELLWKELDECPIPPVYEGCFCNCTSTSANGDYFPTTCFNVGECNSERYELLLENVDEAESMADACG